MEFEYCLVAEGIAHLDGQEHSCYWLTLGSGLNSVLNFACFLASFVVSFSPLLTCSYPGTACQHLYDQITALGTKARGSTLARSIPSIPTVPSRSSLYRSSFNLLLCPARDQLGGPSVP